MVLAVLAVSCGVSGDPGHCYISVDWEYYYSGYGVYYYEDDNPDVPDFEYLDPKFYYASYPGTYEYYYESEDAENYYYYTGVYTLIQNPGSAGGLFHDGLDGADTYFSLFLEIYAKKGLSLRSSDQQENSGNAVSPHPGEEDMASAPADPGNVRTRSWEEHAGDWTLRVEENVKIVSKQKAER